MKSGLILSLGSVNVDIQVRAPRWPEPGETLMVDRFLMTGGGKAANVAYLARLLGAKATLLACVGDDDLAERALAPLRGIGVDLRHVHRAAGEHTAVAVIAVRERDADKSTLLAANANDSWPRRAATDAVRVIKSAPADSILVADLEAPPPLVLRAARAARQRGITVVLDPSPADRVSKLILAACDVVVPNAAEATALTGVTVGDDPQRAIEAGRVLCERGPRVAFVKLRNGGCAVVDGDAEQIAEAPEVDPIDRTGAGDAFAGALAVAMLEGAAPVDAARFAAAASAIAVTRWGSQQAYPTRDELTRTR